tara:strand:+ start:6384 stop:7175 length:792 start_codon:yes stop_codon:yes gene_type:complete
MSEYKAIKQETKGSTMWVRLMRPVAMNSLNLAMLEELETVFSEASINNEIRVIVLTGVGAAFCVGADLKEIMGSLGNSNGDGPDFLDRVANLFSMIRNCPKPVIAGLNGFTMAGGLELTMCCDIVIAAESAKIGDAHSNFGVFPGAGGAAVLPKRVGASNAKYMLFTGNNFSAETMKLQGLVQEVVPDDELESFISELANNLARKSPLVLHQMKEVANASLEMSEKGALLFELKTLRNHFHSYDFKEGLAAFNEKRIPNFKGC